MFESIGSGTIDDFKKWCRVGGNQSNMKNKISLPPKESAGIIVVSVLSCSVFIFEICKNSLFAYLSLNGLLATIGLAAIFFFTRFKLRACYPEKGSSLKTKWIIVIFLLSFLSFWPVLLFFIHLGLKSMYEKNAPHRPAKWVLFYCDLDPSWQQ